jgi:hypothetical protein
LCEAKSGYVWNFVIYIGQDTVFNESLKREAIWLKVVLQLLTPLLNQGYRVIMDNWFSRPDLYHKLCSEQTDAVGTFRQNRKAFPAEILSTKLKKGEHFSVYKERLMIMMCKDKKDICLVSTIHYDKMVPTWVRG